MNFEWTKEQTDLRDSIRVFAEENLSRDLVERDRRGAGDADDWREVWNRCAGFGVLGLNIPKAYGGKGYDALTAVGMLEALGYGCSDNGLTLGLNGQIWAVQEPILAFGTEDQKQRYLPELCNGALIGAHAMTEESSGSNAAGLMTTAEKRDGGYILNGAKTYVGLAPACDIAVVFASTAPEKGSWGLSAFIVEGSAKGLMRDDPQQKMGVRTAPMGAIKLDNCFVPADALLGPEGAGHAIFQHSMEWERSFIFASHVGSMHRQLDQCVKFAHERVVFDQPIDQYQSISNRLAEMKRRLETSRMLLYKAAWLKSQGRSCAGEAALAKLHISESFVESSLDAIRIHGGKGYLSEYGVERDLRDAVGGVIYSGTSDIQRMIISQLLKNQ